MIDQVPPYLVEDRRMLSRIAGDRIRLTHIVQPGSRRTGCLVCCNAPDSCPALSYCCCIDYPTYIVNRVDSSRYIYIRENSLEFNNPIMQAARGSCCGASLFKLAVRDNVTVMYFDDEHFDNVRDSTRGCNNCKTFWCGGRGEQVLIDSRFCFTMCKRGRWPMTFVPSCCPEVCCPCLVEAELWVDDAKSAVEAITMQRDSARERMQE